MNLTTLGVTAKRSTITRTLNLGSAIPLAGAMATLFAVLSGCGSPEKEKEPVVSVQTTPARRGPISQIISGEAVVYPLQQAVIMPKITSTVSKFLVQRGSRVRKGQLLAVLENADLAAAAEQGKGEFEQAEASYTTTTGASLPQDLQKAELDAAAAKAGFDAQQKVYDSRKELFQQGAIPRRDLDSAEVALAQARSQYRVAERQWNDLQRLVQQQALKSASGQLSAAKGKYLGAKAQLSYSEIRSPIDGVVTDRPLYPGELATANQPLLTVMDTTRLIAKTHIAQSEAALLRAGNPADLRIPGLDASLKGRISLVSPALDPGSTTIEVWVEALKADPALKPGMTVEVAMTAKTAKDAIVVPASGLFKNSEGADYVLVAGSDGRAHLKTVQAGIRNAGLAQIVSGISAGEPVIVSGGYALPDNTQIKIAPPAPAEKDAGGQAGKADQAGGSAKPAGKDKE
ncbi:MAG: efflux RND transporter periplasmic adaptor subunit [Acidobacteriia bacterium]|nr:efflux RND transporter periplasmic adaptor subunit [Terriglobia bacterium]